MEHFLNLVAKDLYASFLDPLRGLSHITMVFPNRRARLFFDEYLSKCGDKPVWSPSYMTITELFQSQAELQTADQFKLVSMLYNIYKEQLHTDETPDSFWSWGELMLRDFDDIDRNMCDADGLFACLQNHKEIEGKSFLSDEQNEILKSFFDGFNGDSELKRKYIQIWDALGPIYHRFRRQLKESGLAYDGMLQREVAQSIDVSRLGDGMYAFVGFNSLDNAEKALFRKLRESGKALFYWDYDQSYIEDTSMEAGMFLRQNLAEFPNRIPPEMFNNISKEKDITIIEASSDNAQARYIPKWIDSLPCRPDKDASIVLCDSALLQPVLHSIPSGKTDDVNVTMGFPLSSIPLYGFVSAILDVQRLSFKNDGRLTIEHVGRILNNPLTERISQNAGSIYQELRKSRQYYPEISDIQQSDDALKAIFTPCTDNISLLDNLMAVLRILAPTIGADDSDTIFQPLYSEALYRIYTQTSRFRTLVEDGTLNIGTEMLCKLLRKVMTTTTVPFHGEPAVGMQVMGMIETRNLDFKHVLLLSAAEGTLPSGSSEASFIPYSLRMAFGLTTMQEKSAVASYNFHHLLQRAESITMIYNGNTDTSGIGKGQISRYLLQLIVSGRPVRRLTLEPAHSVRNADQPLSAAKTGSVMEHLYRMYDTADKRNYISPSALNCYIDCKFKYYLQYVAGIRSVSQDPAEIDPSLFGNLFHLSAELTYNSLASQSNDGTITKDGIDAILKDSKRLTSFVREAFRQELFNDKDIDPDSYNGTQSINYEVILRYLRQMLRMDKEYAPFQYIGSESKDFEHYISIPHPDRPDSELRIRISGRIDRMDYKNGIYRIADYKTGHVEENPKSLDDLFTPGPKRRRYALQTFYYATLVRHSKGYEDKMLAPVLLYIRRSAKPTEDNLYMQMNGAPVTDFTGHYLEDYTSRLQQIISEILNRDIPFTQTDIPDTCKNCNFKELCHR